MHMVAPVSSHEEGADGECRDLYPVDIDPAVRRRLFGLTYTPQGQAEPGAADEIGREENSQKNENHGIEDRGIIGGNDQLSRPCR